MSVKKKERKKLKFRYTACKKYLFDKRKEQKLWRFYVMNLMIVDVGSELKVLCEPEEEIKQDFIIW